MVQIGRPQAPRADDGHRGVSQCSRQWADEISHRFERWSQHHDDGTAGTPQRGHQRLPGAERACRADDLIGGASDGVRALADDHDLGSRRAVSGQGRQCRRRLVVPDDDDDRGPLARRLIQPRRHRPERSVERVPVLDDVSWPRRLQFEVVTGVDDPPAGGLDLKLESIGRVPIAGASRGGPLLGECHDRRWHG